MADVAADASRRGESDHGLSTTQSDRVEETGRATHVEVGAIEVDLSSSLVDDVASLLDSSLEDSVRARVRDHESGEVVAVLVSFEAEILEVKVAGVENLDGNDLHARHDGGLRQRTSAKEPRRSEEERTAGFVP